MKTTHTFVVAVIAGAIAANALAHGGATGIVKERMVAMLAIGKAVKNIANMVRKILPYDANEIKRNALIIKNHSGSALIKLFPPNSLQKTSEARIEIWSNWNEFNELANRLETLATGLEIAADNGLSAANQSKSKEKQSIPNENLELYSFATTPVESIFKELAITCKSCHEKFRQKKN